MPTIITWAQGGNNVYVTGTFNGWKHKIKLIKRLVWDTPLQAIHSVANLINFTAHTTLVQCLSYHLEHIDSNLL